jgi:hypothetical protein
MPKGPVETPITDQEIAFAHLVMAGTMTDREAAKGAGLNPKQAAYVKAKPRVKAYMAEHRASVAAAISEHESASLAELNVTRETIMARYWELSQLSVTQTNGNIAGQVRALDSLRDMLGLLGNQVPAKEEEQRLAPDVYQSAWMRNPQPVAEAPMQVETSRSVEMESYWQPPAPPMRVATPVVAQVPAAPLRTPREDDEDEPPPFPNGGFGRF